MLYRVRRSYNYYFLNRLIKSKLAKIYIETDERSSVVLLTQLQQRDIYLYIVALASFCRRVAPRTIYILNDGSLGSEEITFLQQHIASFEIINIKDVNCGKCPKGQIWERLVLCQKLSQESYVIQLDSDTITIGAISEVEQAVINKQSFVLGTYLCDKVVTFAEASKFIENTVSDSPQILAEKNLINISDLPSLYIRGCAGFAGFSHNSVSIDLMEEFSIKMESLLGEKWSKDWGTEQVTSNFLLANSKPVILCEPKYLNYRPKFNLSETSFVHMIGTVRFKHNTYDNLINQEFS